MSSLDGDPALDTASGVRSLPTVRSLYQPVMDLSSKDVVAYEALVRGPGGTSLELPAALFEYARAEGLEQELELEAKAAALRGAMLSRLPASVPLLVNAEPQWLAEPWPKRLKPLVQRAMNRLQIVVEVTERALIADPAGLLAGVRRLRASGAGIALDDVGADLASLALMPFLEPDVIKLDLRLVQHYSGHDVSTISAAVNAQAERTGAILLAEGIETEEHRSIARTLGATLGQGWLLGRPAPLPGRITPAPAKFAFTRPPMSLNGTPFEIAARHRPVRRATKDLLLPMSHHLEAQAMRIPAAPVLLATFEDALHFTRNTARRYESYARECAFVGALGLDMPVNPVPDEPRVRGARLRAGDPVAGEWVVCVVGPHFAGALVAKDLGDTGPDRDRRFDAVLTYDRALVIDIARSLFSRIEPTRQTC